MSGLSVSEDADVLELGQVAEFFSGGTPSKQRDDFWDGETPWVTARDLKSLFLDDAGLSLSDEGRKHAKLAQAGAILVLVRGMMLFKDLPMAIISREMSFNQDIKALVARDGFDNIYLAFNLLANKRRILGLVDSAGHGTGRLDTDLLKNVPLIFPSLEKQKEISRGLQSVEKKIALLTEKRDGLVAYKRGVMQRLFSGALRFTRPDGSAFPDWEERKLGDVADVKKGVQVNRDTLTDEGGYPVINGGTGPSGYLGEFNTSANTITISEGGNSCGYVAWQKIPFWCGGHCYAVAPKGELNNVFLFQLLKSHEPEIMRLRVGSGLPNIQKGDLLKSKLKLPHPDEQIKIAEALSALDAKIDAVSAEISQMETFKKGLLQKMFV